jgi:hypothetical protein
LSGKTLDMGYPLIFANIGIFRRAPEYGCIHIWSYRVEPFNWTSLFRINFEKASSMDTLLCLM